MSKNLSWVDSPYVLVEYVVPVIIVHVEVLQTGTTLTGNSYTH